MSLRRQKRDALSRHGRIGLRAKSGEVTISGKSFSSGARKKPLGIFYRKSRLDKQGEGFGRLEEKENLDDGGSGEKTGA